MSSMKSLFYYDLTNHPVTGLLRHTVANYDSFAQFTFLKREQYVIESQFMAFCSTLICRINLKSKLNFFVSFFSFVQFVCLRAPIEIVAELM